MFLFPAYLNNQHKLAKVSLGLLPLCSVQQSVLKVKSLEEELEEARNNVNVSEEKREQVLWQNKQLVGALPSCSPCTAPHTLL